jgi:hypothetical protein
VYYRKQSIKNYLGALNSALIERTEMQLVRQDTWEDTLNRLADARPEEPVHVTLIIDKYGDPRLEVPDNVVVTTRDYRRGGDCDLCGQFTPKEDLFSLLLKQFGDTKERKSVCGDCYDSKVRPHLEDAVK